jgi:exopolysaccharide biosynthesis polyprenyl glycosylphosphotransferase
MRNIRRRDTIIYFVSSGVSFLLSVYILELFTTSFHYSLLVQSIAFIFGVVDAIFFENTQDIYRLSRMRVASSWFARSFFCMLIFTLLYNGSMKQVSFDFALFFKHWSVWFVVTLITKLIILTWSSYRLKHHVVYYDTLLIGTGDKARHVLNDLQDKLPSQGQHFTGVIGDRSVGDIPRLGELPELPALINANAIDEVIIALEQDQNHHLISILHTLRSQSRDLMIRITPDSYDFLMGRIKIDAVYGAALIELPLGKMRLWQSTLKRLSDLIVSILVLIILLPLIVFIAIKTSLSSPGPVIYTQVRIGRYGIPFKIYKFRSMFIDAEYAGPQLSFDGDARCTAWGAFMRKWRLDEIPQFINVILGEMSIVGPRPEREYFIEKVKNIAPYYTRILTVRPGITSWGQVKYGYASDIDQMVDRLKFDLIYVENQSLTLDIKIILYTILVLFQGKGK